jgi:hypothetical protein
LNSRTIVLQMTLLFACVALLGCGDASSIAAPDLASRARLVRVAATPAYVARGAVVHRRKALDTDLSVTVTIGPRGGSLSIPDAGLTLLFPRGALTSDVSITAYAYAGHRVVYDFEPHGLVFNVPVIVMQRLRGTSLNVKPRNRQNVWGGYMPLGIADVDPSDTGSFSQVFPGSYAGATPEQAYAFFSTTHFSGYAMASGRRGQ